MRTTVRTAIINAMSDNQWHTTAAITAEAAEGVGRDLSVIHVSGEIRKLRTRGRTVQVRRGRTAYEYRLVPLEE